MCGSAENLELIFLKNMFGFQPPPADSEGQFYAQLFSVLTWVPDIHVTSSPPAGTADSAPGSLSWHLDWFSGLPLTRSHILAGIHEVLSTADPYAGEQTNPFLSP